MTRLFPSGRRARAELTGEVQTGKTIVVPYDETHAALRPAIDNIRTVRIARAIAAPASGLLTGMAPLILPFGIYLRRKQFRRMKEGDQKQAAVHDIVDSVVEGIWGTKTAENLKQEREKPPSALQDAKLLLRSLMGPVAAPFAVVRSYKKGSKMVREATNNLTAALQDVQALDEQGRYRIEDLAATHPFLFVDRKGNLILTHRTLVATALHAAQRAGGDEKEKTFFKTLLRQIREVTPGRYRIKLKGETPQLAGELISPGEWRYKKL